MLMGSRCSKNDRFTKRSVSDQVSELLGHPELSESEPVSQSIKKRAQNQVSHKIVLVKNVFM